MKISNHIAETHSIFHHHRCEYSSVTKKKKTPRNSSLPARTCSAVLIIQTTLHPSSKEILLLHNHAAEAWGERPKFFILSSTLFTASGSSFGFSRFGGCRGQSSHRSCPHPSHFFDRSLNFCEHSWHVHFTWTRMGCRSRMISLGAVSPG